MLKADTRLIKRCVVRGKAAVWISCAHAIYAESDNCCLIRPPHAISNRIACWHSSKSASDSDSQNAEYMQSSELQRSVSTPQQISELC